MKPPPLDDFKFPEWYSNDPRKWWSSGSWEDYTDAAFQLDVVKSDEGFYSLKKSEYCDAFTPCHEDLMSSKFREFTCCHTKQKVIPRVIPFSKITMTDCKNFRRLLLEAERNLRLFEEYFTPHREPAMLRHDSTVENVVAQLPLRYINNALGPMFRPLLERLISMAKKQHEEKLYYEYTLFLLNCDRIKCDRIKTDITAAECLEMLKDDPHFVAKKFGDLESHRLERGMQIYLNYWEACARSRLPEELMSPIHFVAFQKRHNEQYYVQHPVKEIMKFRAYFGLFLNGVPPLWRPESVAP